MSESIIITGAENIERVRWLSVRSALKLEMHGLSRSGRGKSARQLANAITGQNCRTREIAYDMLNAHIVSALGPEFDRPRTR
jgi:hypothetical protein